MHPAPVPPPLIYLLLAAGVFTAGLAEYVDSAVIFGVVVVNAIVGFIQESNADAALEGLRSMVRTPHQRGWRLTSATMTPIGAETNSEIRGQRVVCFGHSSELASR